MFLRVFGFGALAFKVSERHVQRLLLEPASQGFIAEPMTLTSALLDHARDSIAGDHTGIGRCPSRSCFWMRSNRVPSTSLQRLPAQSPNLIIFSSCSHLETFQES
jgi:hypothetical protein